MKKHRGCEIWTAIILLVASRATSYDGKALRHNWLGNNVISSLLFVILSVGSYLFPQVAYGFDVTLSWDANADEILGGYRIYYREEGSDYDYNEPIWVGFEDNCTIYNLYDDTPYCFVVRAVDVDGNESGDSNETCLKAEVFSTDTTCSTCADAVKFVKD
jgi:hypothetical protein